MPCSLASRKGYLSRVSPRVIKAGSQLLLGRCPEPDSAESAYYQPSLTKPISQMRKVEAPVSQATSPASDNQLSEQILVIPNCILDTPLKPYRASNNRKRSSTLEVQSETLITVNVFTGHKSRWSAEGLSCGLRRHLLSTANTT